MGIVDLVPNTHTRSKSQIVKNKQTEMSPFMTLMLINSLFMMYLEKQKEHLRITRNNKIMMMFLVLVIQPICASIQPFWQGGIIYTTFLAASSFYLYKPSTSLQIKKDE